MINVEWRSVAHGFDYKKYLQRQVQDVLDDVDQINADPKMAYYAKSGEFSLENLTRISGGLADRFGLSGPADMKKLEAISELELGNHPDVIKSLRIKNKITHVLDHPSLKETIEVTKKDIKRCWVEVDGEKIRFTKDQVKEEVATNRRTSLELVLSLDKSFSYLFFSDALSMPEKKIFQELLFQAKHTVLEEIIAPMLVTNDGKKGELLFYDFMHLDNREQDPHIHIHSNISNLIRLPNGKFKVIEPRELFKKGTAERADFQFKAIVLKLMQERLPNIPIEAYDNDFQAVNASGKNVSETKDFRVAFDDETTKEIRSKYTHDKKIKDKVDLDKKNLYQKNQNLLTRLKSDFEHGKYTKNDYLDRVAEINDKYQNDFAHLSSRKYDKLVQRQLVDSKKIVSLHEKQEQLVQKVSEIDIKLKPLDEVKEIRRAYTDEQILENLTNRSPKFTRNDLIKDIAKYRGLGVEAQWVADSILKKNADIFALPTKAHNTRSPFDQPTFTLRSLAELEHENMQLLEKISKQEHKQYQMDDAIQHIERREKISFKVEQADYLKNVFSKHGGSLIVGLPGTGKSFAMKHAVAMAKTMRRMTYGLAPTGKVASAIADESGTDYAATIDKFLIDIDNGKAALKEDDIVFVDEAGMIGTRNYNRLLKVVADSGAKLVLIGDNNQLDPVSAGNTFNEFIRAHADKPFTSILSEISRQKDADALKIAQAVSGQSSMAQRGGSAQEQLQSWQTDREAATHTRDAFGLLETFGLVQQFDTSSDMLDAAMTQFTKQPEPYDQKIMLASTNKTVDLLNTSIQAQRQSAGELGRSVEVGGEHLHIKDRVVILKNTKEVKNGDFGTILDIYKDGSLLVKFDNGAMKTVNPETTNISLGYAMTVHKSQGITKTKTYHVGEVSQLNNAQLFNVAATRNTQQYQFFAVASEYDAVKESYCRASDKISLLDVREIIQAAPPKASYSVQLEEKKERLAAYKQAEIESSTRKIDSPEELQKTVAQIELEHHYLNNPPPSYQEIGKRLIDALRWKVEEVNKWLRETRDEVVTTDKNLLSSMPTTDLTDLCLRELINRKVESLLSGTARLWDKTPVSEVEIIPHPKQDAIRTNTATQSVAEKDLPVAINAPVEKKKIKKKKKLELAL